jgi:hypothetical protein
MFDIDGFKQINDVHDHEAGDNVLKRIGAMLGRRLRDTDLVAATSSGSYFPYAGDRYACPSPGAQRARSPRRTSGGSGRRGPRPRVAGAPMGTGASEAPLRFALLAPSSDLERAYLQQLPRWS